MSALKTPLASKPHDVWSGKELTDAINAATGQNLGPKMGGAMLCNLRLQLGGKPSQATYQGVVIPAEAFVAYVVSGGMVGQGIRKDYGQRIVAAYAARQKDIAAHAKPEGFWSSGDLFDALQAEDVRNSNGRPHSLTHAHTLIAKIRKQHEEGRYAVSHGITVPRAAIAQYREKGSGSTGYAIDGAIGRQIVEALKEEADRRAGRSHAAALRDEDPAVRSRG